MDKGELKSKIFDEMLVYASEQSASNIIEDLPKEKELMKSIKLSLEFEVKMKNLINKHKRKERYRNVLITSRRIAITLTVIMLLGTVTIMSVDAFRIRIFNILTDWNEEYIQFKFKEDENINLDNNQPSVTSQNSNNSIYILDYIPEGYELLNTQEAGELHRVVYVRGDERITFIQSKIDTTDTAIDTEDASVIKITISDNEAYLIERTEINSLVWQNNGKVFTIHGDIEKSELIKIAESIKLQKNKK